MPHITFVIANQAGRSLVLARKFQSTPCHWDPNLLDVDYAGPVFPGDPPMGRRTRVAHNEVLQTWLDTPAIHCGVTLLFVADAEPGGLEPALLGRLQYSPYSQAFALNIWQAVYPYAAGGAVDRVVFVCNAPVAANSPVQPVMADYRQPDGSHVVLVIAMRRGVPTLTT